MVLGYRSKLSGKRIECWQFKGQMKKFDDAPYWLKEKVSWFNPIKVELIDPDLKIKVYMGIGDWTVRNEDGLLIVLTDAAFKDAYEEIPPQVYEYDDHDNYCPTCGHYKYYDDYYW